MTQTLAMHPNRRRLDAFARALVASILVSGLITLFPSLAAAAEVDAATTPRVTTTTVNGPITPVMALHIADVVLAAESAGDDAVVVYLDTPGGLVTSMRDIVQTFLGAEVPVIVYVSPAGADAGSAGTFITMAAHVAAMAPATTIGAATPVQINGGEVGDKIVNNAAAYAETIAETRDRDVEFAIDAVRDGRSITSEEALEIGAIDMIVEDTPQLLADSDGFQTTVNGQDHTVRTADATLVERELSGTRKILQILADPNLAFIFSSLGIIAIVYEIASPGLGAGGIIGGICIILLLFSASALPINTAGLALLGAAGIFFVAELFAPGIGIGAGGGTIALVLAGIFLFDEPSGLGVDASVIAALAMTLLGLGIGAGKLASGVRNTTPVTDETFAGVVGTVLDAPDGPRLRAGGTTWRVRLEDGSQPAPGSHVEVTSQDGSDLIARTKRSGTP